MIQERREKESKKASQSDKVNVARRCIYLQKKREKKNLIRDGKNSLNRTQYCITFYDTAQCDNFVACEKKIDVVEYHKRNSIFVCSRPLLIHADKKTLNFPLNFPCLNFMLFFFSFLFLPPSMFKTFRYHFSGNHYHNNRK